MQLNVKDLFANVPELEMSDSAYLFNEPEIVYTDKSEAEQNLKPGEKTYPLDEVLSKIYQDIRHDA